MKRVCRWSPCHPSVDTAYVVRLLQRAREYGLRLPALHEAIEHHLREHGLTAEDAIRGEHQQQAATLVSVTNVLTSLRLCSTLDWSHYFETVSLVEQVLQRDPAGVYGAMDFLSRDRQRRAVEELAAPNGEAQVGIALRAIESARQAAEARSMTDRAAHVGYHLVGDGRRDLEADIGFRPRASRRFGRFILDAPGACYLGSVGLITALLVGLGVWYVGREGGRLAMQLWVGLLLLVPASEAAIVVVQRLAALLIRPRRLLRLAFQDGLPPHARTMVIVPVLLTTVAEVEELLDRLEVAALANMDPRIHFAILGDFVDAPRREMAEDAVLIAAARHGIDALNQRHGQPDGSRFFLFHRERRWNARDRIWMGWERKRGKIEEFNRLLRGATDTSFSVQVGALDVLPSIRYCLTLDSDTRLSRDAARKLVGIITHPLNQAYFDPVSRRVTNGYGILQPRVSVTIASVMVSPFARIFAGHTGVDPYTTAVSDVYQDLFDEGIFTGKGLYDVDAFMAALEGRVPENAVLSHDLFEGLYARTALVSDIEVVDDYPASVLAHARRQHRWTRGDWQLLPWLLPIVPTRNGLGPQRPAAFRALEDPRQLEAQSPGAGHRHAVPFRLDVFARQSERVDGGDVGRPDMRGILVARRGRRRPPTLAALARVVPQPARRYENGAGARRTAVDVRGLQRLPDDARDRRHPRSRVRDAPEDARVADGGDIAASDRRRRARGNLVVRRADGAGRAARDRGARRERRDAAARAARGLADSPVVDGCAVAGVRVQPAASAWTTRHQGGRSPPAPPDGPQDVAILRYVRGSVGPLAGAGQRSGHVGPEDCAPDVTHQHRDASARHAGRLRSSVHRRG